MVHRRMPTFPVAASSCACRASHEDNVLLVNSLTVSSFKFLLLFGSSKSTRNLLSCKTLASSLSLSCCTTLAASACACSRKATCGSIHIRAGQCRLQSETSPEHMQDSSEHHDMSEPWCKLHHRKLFKEAVNTNKCMIIFQVQHGAKWSYAVNCIAIRAAL